jgi:hypothetical protein
MPSSFLAGYMQLHIIFITTKGLMGVGLPRKGGAAQPRARMTLPDGTVREGQFGPALSPSRARENRELHSPSVALTAGTQYAMSCYMLLC